MQGKRTSTALLALTLTAAVLSGCGGGDSGSDLALELRASFIAMEQCAGTMDITADYGQRVYEYTVEFTGERKKGLDLVLTAPEEVAGITAHVAQGQTALEFDGLVLETGPLNEEGLSPLDALPSFIASMQSGYIAESGTETVDARDYLRLTFREPEKDAGQGTESILWFDQETKELRWGELRSGGRTVVRCSFCAFTLAGPSAEKGTE